MIDSGNTVSTGCAITKELHKQLGVGLVRTGAGTVNTALPGAKIQKIGRSNPIEIEIAGTSPPIRTSIQPIVVDQLSDPLNLGSGFLHELSLQQGIPINLRYDGEKSFLEIGGEASRNDSNTC